MIGLDANILLRAVLDDDATQSPLAREVLSRLTADNPGVVNGVVLAEFAWTLRRGYDYSRSDIIQAIRTMLRSRGYAFPDRRAISLALSRCESDGLNFPDTLIGEINRTIGCEVTLTFDEKAAKSSAFQRAH